MTQPAPESSPQSAQGAASPDVVDSPPVSSPRAARPSRRTTRSVGAPAAFVKSLGRFLYNHNPFYVASAWMVFRGLRVTFATGDQFFPSGMLALSLTGYVALLAATAVLVVRFGKVWDDARTILLLIVLMLLGVSVTLDDELARRPEIGARYCCVAWLFAVAVSESVLRSLGLRLPGWYRVGYHALLGLFFLYPAAMAPYFGDPDSPALKWLLYGFSWAAAAGLLTLLPAVSRGPDYANDNGSPWRWPLYPWTLFATLVGCAGLRAWYLCYSLHFVDYEQTMFGLYFLVPLVLAVGLLMGEAGRATRSAALRGFALATPALALWLSVVGHRFDRVYVSFLSLYQDTLASPFYVTLVLTAAFYLIESWRRTAGARTLLTATLVALACLPERPLWPEGVEPRPWALAALAAWQGAAALGQRRAGNMALATGCGLAALVAWLPGTALASHHAALAWNLGFAGCLASAVACRDATAPWIERLGAWSLTWLALGVALGAPGRDLPPGYQLYYPPLIAAGLCGYAAWTKHWRSCALPVVAPLGVWLAHYGAYTFDELRRHVHGLGQLLWGLAFFVCAAVVSLLKTAIGQHWAERLATRWRSPAASDPPPRPDEPPQA